MKFDLTQITLALISALALLKAWKYYLDDSRKAKEEAAGRLSNKEFENWRKNMEIEQQTLRTEVGQLHTIIETIFKMKKD